MALEVPRVAAVSGSSSGIGRAIARKLAELGWRVAIGARRAPRVEEAAGEIRAAGGEVYAGPLDVADAASVHAFFDAAERELGPVDAAVSCAAHARPGRLHELDPQEIRAVIETGLVGALWFAREGVRRLRARGAPGDVLFVSSTSAAVPWPLLAAYAASKAGLEQAARTLSLELEGTGIRALVVRPGNTIGTGWADGWSPEELAATAEWQRHGLLRHDRMLTPDQVAQAVVAALAAPRGVQLDHVSVHPEAPGPGSGSS